MSSCKMFNSVYNSYSNSNGKYEKNHTDYRKNINSQNDILATVRSDIIPYMPRFQQLNVPGGFAPLNTFLYSEYWNYPGKFVKKKENRASRQKNSQQSDESCDSGLSSRSPTPNRQDFSQVHINYYKKLQENKLINNTISNNNVSVSNCRPATGQNRKDQNHLRRKTNHSNKLSTSNSLKNRKNNDSPFPTTYQTSNKNSGKYYIAPERFLYRSHLIEFKETPEHLLNGSVYDDLSKGIWNKFINEQQTEGIYIKKMYLWKFLYNCIKSYSSRFGLYLVGSTLSGFGSNSSDVDMCLLVRPESDQREAFFYLTDIQKLLQQIEFIGELEIIQAKVPILKFCDVRQNLQIDLNCNNSVGIRNTHLLYCYSKLDWRVRPLGLIVKLWAQYHGINEAKNMTISSYSLILMVIHFLQCGVKPVVLPCLHTMYEDKFYSNSEISSIEIHDNQIYPYYSENILSVGELLVKFFQYFASFDYSKYAISVRTAGVIPIEHCRFVRTPKNDPYQWKYLCIEEPFDLTNTARSVYDLEIFNHIKQLITETAKVLSTTLRLEDIFANVMNRN